MLFAILLVTSHRMIENSILVLIFKLTQHEKIHDCEMNARLLVNQTIQKIAYKISAKILSQWSFSCD